jgi:hypothetical protein
MASDGPRGILEHLAAIERGPCSPGEREAAEWIRDRLAELGCEAAVEEERAFSSYAPALGMLGAAAVAAGVAALAGRSRFSAALVAGAAAAGIAEDASNGPRLFRRLVMRRRPTWNVVARAGDPSAAETLVVLAHHDAHPTGFIFDQSGARWAARRFPRLLGGGRSLPFWWPVVGSPALVAVGAAIGSRRMIKLGLAGSLFGLAAAADLSRNRIVPGANDNLCAVAALAGLAASLRDAPAAGVRVLLVSCGSEESLQGGIYGFLERHGHELPPERTSFLNFELLGASHHVLLEGEGPLRVTDYAGAGFRDLVARAAERVGVELRRGVRSHVSTDSVVPSRLGYPTGTLITVDDEQMVPNYHLMSDTPENVHLDGIRGGVAVARAVVDGLAGRPRG